MSWISEVDALDYAFRMEAKLILPHSLNLEPRGTNPYDDTLLDRIRHGMIIKGIAMEHMGLGQGNVIVAEFTRPSYDTLIEKKERAFYNLATLYLKNKPLDIWFVIDMLRLHLSNKNHHPLTWWARRGKTSRKSIYNANYEIKKFSRYWRERALMTARMNLIKSGHLTS